MEKLASTRRSTLTSDNDERDVYFFMAYLLRREADLGFDIPADRSAYRLIGPSRPGRPNSQLEVKIQLSQEVSLAAPVCFSSGLEPRQIDTLTEELAGDLERLPLHKNDIVDEVLNFREEAKKVFTKLRRKKLQVRFCSLEFDLREAIRTGEPAYLLTYEKLGQDAHPAKASVPIYEMEEIESQLSALVDEQRVLADRARELEEESADGTIDLVLLHRAAARHRPPSSYQNARRAGA